MIKDEISWRAFFIFCVCFGPVFSNFWQWKTTYDARFEQGRDIVHILLEIFHLCALATAVVHIRPARTMIYVADNPEMFLFSLGLVWGTIIQFFWPFEIAYLAVRGQTNAQSAGKQDCIICCIAIVTSLTAFIWSGILYYGNNNGDDVHHSKEAYHPTEYWGPGIVLLVGWILRPVITFFRALYYNHLDFTKLVVPMNVDFIIHRYGEWMMLMLGESILSLLIVVEVSSSRKWDYYITFYAGILSVAALQFLFFKSQPSHANEHALRRKREAGLIYVTIVGYYSASLILIGVSFKLLVGEYSSAYDILDDDPHATDPHDIGRASSSGPVCLTYECMSERRYNITVLFAVAHIVSFTLLDLMSLNHVGFKNTFKKMWSPNTGAFRLGPTLWVLGLRLGAVVALGLMPIIDTRPDIVAIVGFASVIVQIITRFLGEKWFSTELRSTLKRLKTHKSSSNNLKKDIMDSEDDSDQPKIDLPGAPNANLEPGLDYGTSMVSDEDDVSSSSSSSEKNT